MYKVYLKPAIESDYLKGIIRSNIVKVGATDRYNSGRHGSEFSVIGNDFEKYWHTILDSSFTQYLQIDFKYVFVEVSSYLFSSGNNNYTYDNGQTYNPFYSKNWNVSCSADGKNYEVIDYHINEKAITYVKQKILFDMKKIKVCNSFRIHITGEDNKHRSYGYLGPIEFFGGTYQTKQPITQCIKRRGITAKLISNLNIDK